MSQIAELKEAAAAAEIEKKKELAKETDKIRKAAKEQEDLIRKEAEVAAEDKYKVQLEQKEIKLKQAESNLEKAQKQLGQGSQQEQGDALERIVDRELKPVCRLDEFVRTPKGKKGGDITQTVINNKEEICGIILWEVKKAKWQKEWIETLEKNMVAAKATFGVLVVDDLPEKYGEGQWVSDAIFITKPRFAQPLALTLRSQIVKVFELQNKQVFPSKQYEEVYKFFFGGQFKSNLKLMLEHYDKAVALINNQEAAMTEMFAEQRQHLSMCRNAALTLSGGINAIANQFGTLPLLSDGEETVS